MFHVDAIDMEVRKVTNILIEVQGCFQSANAFHIFLHEQTRSGQRLSCPEVELYIHKIVCPVFLLPSMHDTRVLNS